jgi:HEAT repeat protein
MRPLLAKLAPFLFVLACLAFPLELRAAEKKAFRAGAATSNITPPLGMSVIGGFQPFPSTHVHDELHARALVLDDGEQKLALVVCDLLGIHKLVSDEARKLIAEKVGIPASHVMISATHTHSASSAMGDDRFKHAQEMDAYQHHVASRIADAVRIANNNLRPAEIAWGTASAPEHVFNRRWYMKPGTMPANPFGGIDQVKMNPPAGSPNLLEPAGPTDPTISFLALREPGGKPIAVYAAYSLHYVGGVGSGHISADYYAMYSDELTRLLAVDRQDPPFVALMANGTSGDINNINFRTPRPRQAAYVQMQKVADDVAAKVKAAVDKATYHDTAKLDARYRELELPWRHPTAEQLAWAKETIAGGKKTPPGKADLSYAYAERTVRLADYPATTPVPLQVLRIGDVCIGSMPCEVFAEIGLEFKERCPLQPAFMVELNHGYFGYLPPPRQHRLGGYETWIGTNRFEPDASVKMLDALLEMAAEIKAADGEKVSLDPATKARCLTALLDGLQSPEFWPAMHAAEALTLAGQQKEVLESLATRAADDDQQRCGLAREAVRAGDRARAKELLAILGKAGSNGHTHAAESLFKVHAAGDGELLRSALAQSKDLKLKLMAAAALARAENDAQALEVIRKHLRHDQLEARQAAVWILGQIGTPSDVPAIAACLAAETDPLARAYCINALACLGDSDARHTLAANLASDNPAIRTYAAEFAGHARASELRDQLVALLDDDTLDVRVRAAQSLLLLARNR